MKDALKKIGEALKEPTPVEHVIRILQAATPLIGDPVAGSIVSLIVSYIPAQRKERLEDFTKAIAKDLERFKDEVNDDYIKTNEFAFIFEKCFKCAMENYRHEKILAFRSIIINSLRENKYTQEHKEFYLTLADRLSVLHLRVLLFFTEPKRFLKESNLPDTNVSGSFGSFFPTRVMPELSKEHAKIIMQELLEYGFIKYGKSIFGTMMISGGYDLLGSNMVTAEGNDFIKFITLYEADSN